MLMDPCFYRKVRDQRWARLNFDVAIDWCLPMCYQYIVDYINSKSRYRINRNYPPFFVNKSKKHCLVILEESSKPESDEKFIFFTEGKLIFKNGSLILNRTANLPDQLHFQVNYGLRPEYFGNDHSRVEDPSNRCHREFTDFESSFYEKVKYYCKTRYQGREGFIIRTVVIRPQDNVYTIQKQVNQAENGCAIFRHG